MKDQSTVLNRVKFGATKWPMQLPRYIPAIDGLRAIAVGLVIAFHLEPSLLKGGFIGVDIFFVISGFLISGIIVDDINAGRFSYGRFLLRRVRRLAPALLTVLAFSSMVAFLVEYPDELLAFSNSLISTITLVSNFYFMQDEGYFSQAAETQLLLHTWSLSVEEQFYLLFPICMLIASMCRVGSASFIRSALPSAKIIDLTSKFCDSISCSAFSGGKPICRDNNHVTFQFSASIPDSFLPALQNSETALSGK